MHEQCVKISSGIVVAGLLSMLGAVADEATNAVNALVVEGVVGSHALHDVDSRIFGQFMERASWGNPGPEAAVDNDAGGLRPDVARLLSEMPLTSVRFPGGTDVDYVDWTDMIDNAPGRENPGRPVTVGHQGHKITNRFGLDAFLRLAEARDCEVVLSLNFRDALLKIKPLEEAALHAAGMIAYANTPVGADLPEGMPDWPAVRAKNGREKTYGVTHANVGNEIVFFMPGESTDEVRDWAIACLVAYADAIHAVDPNVKLITDLYPQKRGSPLNVQIAADQRIRERYTYLACHRYRPMERQHVFECATGKQVDHAALAIEDWWYLFVSLPGDHDASGLGQGVASEIDAASALGYDIAVTEWNWNGWGAAVSAGGPRMHGARAVGVADVLHGFMRHGDRVKIAHQSLLLGQWGIAAIRFDAKGQRQARFTSTGQVTKLYASYHGYERLPFLITRNPALPRLKYNFWPAPPEPWALTCADLVATRDDDAVYLHAVNRAYDQPVALGVDLEAAAPDGKGVWHLLVLDVKNPPEDRHMHELKRGVTLTGRRLEAQLPPGSVSVFVIPRR